MKDEDDFIVQYRLQLIAEEKEKLSKNSQIIQDFKKHCRAKGLELRDVNFQYIQPIGIVANYPNLLSILYPEIPIDKEGLVDLDYLVTESEINPFLAGRILIGNIEILVSPYFRRGYNERSSYTPNFVSLFQFKKNESYIRSILLDANRVRIDIDGPMCCERDTWYGAKFDKNIAGISDGNAKLRPPGHISDSHISFFFGDVYSLDIKWETKNRIKTFQLEEFKTEKITLTKESKLVYPVRYVHAEYDIENNEFRHFDGAIHFYTEKEYYARRDSDFNYNTKNTYQIKTNSIKLFKINGKLPLETWVELTSHFLHGNPLIFEYYEGKYPRYILEFLERIKELGSGG